jgi:hypothetical protein
MISLGTEESARFSPLQNPLARSTDERYVDVYLRLPYGGKEILTW